MKASKTPILISIPHGGRITPNEVVDVTLLNDNDILLDGDAYTKEIYHLPELAQCIVTMDIARAYIDVNRLVSHLPPEYPDGVIKHQTCQGKYVYQLGKEPDKQLTKLLLEKYYYSYHKQLYDNLKKYHIELMLDCHTMAERAPMNSHFPGTKRPLICISNCKGRSASFELAEKLKHVCIKIFNIPSEEVTINNPFKGGYIATLYGNNPCPVLQIELNRSLYTKMDLHGKPEFDLEKVKQLHILFRETVNEFC